MACFCSLFLICLQVCILRSEAGQFRHHDRFLFFVHLCIIVVWHISFPTMFWFCQIHFCSHCVHYDPWSPISWFGLSLHCDPYVLLFRFHFPQFVSSWPITPQA
ncbi:hypothetical protein AAHE18_02G100400 [Arachis hypogaea]